MLVSIEILIQLQRQNDFKTLFDTTMAYSLLHIKF